MSWGQADEAVGWAGPAPEADGKGKKGKGRRAVQIAAGLTMLNAEVADASARDSDAQDFVIFLCWQ